MKFASLPFAFAGTLALASFACGGTNPPPEPPPSPKPVQGYLLLHPNSDAESLLGRAVTLSDKGGYIIADERVPGCDVTVRHSPAQFVSTRRVKASTLAAIGAGYQEIASLEAKYGSDSEASLELRNAETVEADLRGDCGPTVITKVFVGKGKRRLFAGTQWSSEGGLAPAGIGASAKAGSSEESLDEIAWDSDEAYAFDVRQFASSESPLQLNVGLPSILTEGEELHIPFQSTREAYLIVLYVDSNGEKAILWPSNEEPSPRVVPGKKTFLPSPTETAAGIKIRPTLTTPGVAAREQLVVYAFSDSRDFDLVKPAASPTPANAAQYQEWLVAALRQIPSRRWIGTALGYQIQPATRSP